VQFFALVAGQALGLALVDVELARPVAATAANIRAPRRAAGSSGRCEEREILRKAAAFFAKDSETRR
jgi:hypothetical protein